MAFIEERFPVDIAYGATGGPEYSTDIVITHGGYEQRNANWLQSRAVYNVAHGVKTQAQLDALIAFFRARRGRADGFRFKDWTDYQATGQSLGLGNGTRTEFQLLKNYTSGGVTTSRTIRKPVAGSERIYLNGALQSSGYNLFAPEGRITFATAPVSGVEVKADFEFDVPVRFDTDRLAATLDSYAVRSWQDIPLVEIRI